MQKYSYNFMRGWNWAHEGRNKPKTWYNDDARKGYYGYLAADRADQVPFRKEDVDAANPGLVVNGKSLLRHFEKREKAVDDGNAYRANWYAKARAWILRADAMEEMLRKAELNFRKYAATHDAKATMSGREKAMHNRELADEIVRVLLSA